MFKFRKSEVRDIILSIAVLSVAFSGIGPDMPGLSVILMNIAIVSVPLALAFAVHEIAHKKAAAAFGYQSFYQMWGQGLLMALFFGIISSGRIIFAAPGAVIIQTAHATQRENGIISLVGPLTNLAIAGFFFLLLLTPGITSILFAMAAFGVRINLLLALFNLLPFPPLDGSKIFRWRPEIAVPLLVFTGIVFFLLFF